MLSYNLNINWYLSIPMKSSDYTTLFSIWLFVGNLSFLTESLETTRTDRQYEGYACFEQITVFTSSFHQEHCLNTFYKMK